MSEKITIQVSGMGCSGCEETVAAAVATGCGEATEISADHRSGTVTFACPGAENLPAVRDAIGAAGYTVAPA